MSTSKLGLLATGETDRDAIHIAVAPVVAGEDLMPGQRVGIVNGKAMATGLKTDTVGIVDPFCRFNIKQDDKFWLFMYPDTITGLRHQWSHPAFANPDDIEWLKKFAESSGMDYDKLMASAHDACDTGASGPGFRYNVDDDYKHEFWLRFGRVTGKGPAEEDGWYFFSCSC